jgi:hypothetical protein
LVGEVAVNSFGVAVHLIEEEKHMTEAEQFCISFKERKASVVEVKEFFIDAKVRKDKFIIFKDGSAILLEKLQPPMVDCRCFERGDDPDCPGGIIGTSDLQ